MFLRTIVLITCFLGLISAHQPLAIPRGGAVTPKVSALHKKALGSTPTLRLSCTYSSVASQRSTVHSVPIRLKPASTSVLTSELSRINL